MTVDLDAEGVTLTLPVRRKVPTYHFNAGPAPSVKAPSGTSSNPVCDGQGAVTKVEMTVTEADDARCGVRICRTGASFPLPNDEQGALRMDWSSISGSSKMRAALVRHEVGRSRDCSRITR